MIAARTKPEFRRAFTLIELLVVITVIGILASLLLPALSRAKEAGRSTACRNNLRQMGLAANLYAGDAGRFPSMLEWLYQRTQPGVLTSGQLYPYVKSKPVFLCPVDAPKAYANVVAGGQPRLVMDHSYTMNCRMCHAHDVTKCLAPARTVYFVEALNLQLTLSSASIAPPGDGFRLGDGQLAFRHSARAHLLMVDTHVERLKLKQATASGDKRLWYPNNNDAFTGGL